MKRVERKMMRSTDFLGDLLMRKVIGNQFGEDSPEYKEIDVQLKEEAEIGLIFLIYEALTNGDLRTLIMLDEEMEKMTGETETQKEYRHANGLIPYSTKCPCCGTLHSEEDANIAKHGTMTIFHVHCKVCTTEFKLRKSGGKRANW